MIDPRWYVFALIVLVLAYLSASYHRHQGYPFWRTFILAIMGFAGIGLLAYRIFIGP